MLVATWQHQRQARTENQPSAVVFALWSHSNKADVATNEFYNPHLAVSHKKRFHFSHTSNKAIQIDLNSHHLERVVGRRLHGHLALGVGDDVALDLGHLVAHLNWLNSNRNTPDCPHLAKKEKSLKFKYKLLHFQSRALHILREGRRGGGIMTPNFDTTVTGRGEGGDRSVEFAVKYIQIQFPPQKINFTCQRCSFIFWGIIY